MKTRSVRMSLKQWISSNLDAEDTTTWFKANAGKFVIEGVISIVFGIVIFAGA